MKRRYPPNDFDTDSWHPPGITAEEQAATTLVAA